MKSKECKKHNHKLTSFLKVFIYMLVMLAPFIAIGVKCWYVANNKNAMESYRGEYYFEAQINFAATINTTTKQYDLDTELNEGQIMLNCDIKNRGDWSGFGINTDYYKFTYENVEYEGTKPLLFYVGRNACLVRQANTYLDNNFDVRNYTNLSEALLTIPYNYILQVEIEYKNMENYSLLPISSDSSSSVINGYENTFIIDRTLSNVFYSSIQELDSASIFSWTTDTGIYTAINNMCVNLGIVSPPLAVLLTYWSLITAIYIIIDIVIESFTFLTHWFTDKMV